MISKRYIYMITGFVTMIIPSKYRRPIFSALSLIFFIVLLEIVSSNLYSYHIGFAYANQSILLLKNIFYSYPISYIQTFVENSFLSHIIYLVALAIILLILKVNSNETKLSIVLILVILVLYRFQ